MPLSEKDREAIKTIREYYGVQTDAGAIRIALHELERLIKGATPPQPQIRNAFHPPHACLILTHIFGKTLATWLYKAEVHSIPTRQVTLPGAFIKLLC